MPRSIKPRMTKDELSAFDARIDSVEFVEGEAKLTIHDNYSGNFVSVWLSESDLEDIIQFIRRNKL